LTSFGLVLSLFVADG